MDDIRCQLKEYIQPFERKLAVEEFRALTGSELIPLDGDRTTACTFTARSSLNTSELRSRLAYWRSIGAEPEGITDQLRGEVTVEIARKHAGFQAIRQEVSAWQTANLPRRRCLRYGTHGLHEYRGKFFPQLVRALMNIGGLSRDGIVIDPMCGSGTTLVEATTAGQKCVGLDMNPLSVFLTEVKCGSLSLRAEDLVASWRHVREKLRTTPSGAGVDGHSKTLPEGDYTYLTRWFAGSTLVELDHIESVIGGLQSERIRDFYRACLSNILRGVSWQKDDDLRVRRDKMTLEEGAVVARFLVDADRATRTVAAFLLERGGASLGEYKVLRGDAREAATLLSGIENCVDLVITSPPYATALPYIDTDRLSLIYLGLLPRGSHRRCDMRMIGNREITTSKRREYRQFYRDNGNELPKQTRALVDRIHRLNREGKVGFRRRNLSALLAKYFFDMRTVMAQMHRLLRPGGTMFVVVGNNRTTAGGKLVEIRTADHLAAIGKDAEFELVDDIGMDMLVSRDIFRRNAVPSERILRFRKSR